MKGGLEVIIRGDGLLISHGRGEIFEEFRGEDVDAGECLHSFTDKHDISSTSVSLFISEDLTFVTSIDLPAKTPDIGEAVRFQFGLVAPFLEDDSLYSYVPRREGEVFRTTIFVAQAKLVSITVDELIEAGFEVTGLYPESQRYVSGKMGKNKWALVFPGKYTKVFIFSGISLVDRLLCNPDLSFDKLAELCGTEEIYHVSPPEGSRFRKTDTLLEGAPVLKEFNMLPASYRRPDYLRMILIALLAINVCALVFVAGYKLKSLDRTIDKTQAEITEILPLVKEVNSVKAEIRKSRSFLESVQGLGANPDLITFLASLTEELPETSYLDQLRYDEGEKVVTLQGYTENVGELTEMLQTLGEARLKSTSRRKNKTYFQVEIGLQ